MKLWPLSKTTNKASLVCRKTCHPLNLATAGLIDPGHMRLRGAIAAQFELKALTENRDTPSMSVPGER